MSPQLVRLLTILLLILIHLFLLRVIRAIWVGIKPTRDMRSRVNPFIKGHRPANVLIVRTPETLNGQRHELTEEITIGRAATCEVTIDDSYASQIHARIFRRDGDSFAFRRLAFSNSPKGFRADVFTGIYLCLVCQVVKVWISVRPYKNLHVSKFYYI